MQLIYQKWSLEKAVKATSVETSKLEPAKETKVLRRGIFANKVAKQPSAKKLAVISDVNNIIEKKLGKNTYADQSKVYANNATKMRAGMLPEIFASIKEQELKNVLPVHLININQNQMQMH